MASAEEKRADKLARAEEAESAKKKALRLGKQAAEKALAARSAVPTLLATGLGPAISAGSGYASGVLAGRYGSAQNPHGPTFVKAALETMVGIGLAAASKPTAGEQFAHAAAGSWAYLAGDTGYRHGQEMRAKANAPNPGPTVG